MLFVNLGLKDIWVNTTKSCFSVNSKVLLDINAGFWC